MAKLIPYIDEEKGLHLHLRKDPSGYGVLIINATKVVYLNKTATLYVEAMLKKMKPEKVAKMITRKFKGVTFDQALKDYYDVVYKVQSIINLDVCPVSSLGFKRIDPLTLKLSAPYRVDLALTYRCNNKCIHCYSASPRHVEKELSTKGFKKIIKKLFKVGVPHVTFTGGEPTLRDDLTELVSFSQKLGIVSGIVSNGRRLSDYEYLKELEKAGLDYVQITLESSIPEIHDKITGVKGSWDETIEGIKNILKTRVYLDVNVTLNSLNIDHVEDIVEFLHSIGVKRISANKLIHSGKALEIKDWFEPKIDELKEALEKMIEKCYELGIKFSWYGVTRYCELNPLSLGLDVKFCSACSVTLAIEPDGNVIPCQSYFKSLGNILKDKWEKIWYSEMCEYFRKRLYAHPLCKNCRLFNLCGGGCPLEKGFVPTPL